MTALDHEEIVGIDKAHHILPCETNQHCTPWNALMVHDCSHSFSYVPNSAELLVQRDSEPESLEKSCRRTSGNAPAPPALLDPSPESATERVRWTESKLRHLKESSVNSWGCSKMCERKLQQREGRGENHEVRPGYCLNDNNWISLAVSLHSTKSCFRWMPWRTFVDLQRLVSQSCHWTQTWLPCFVWSKICYQCQRHQN